MTERFAPLEHRWAIRLLLAVGQGVCRPLALERALGSIPRRTLRQRLADLTAAGWLERRAFDGYPRRVEYHLTTPARAFLTRWEALARAGVAPAVAEEVLKCKWMGAILRLLAQSPRYTGDLERHLPGISPKMLSERLKKLVRFGLVARQVVPDWPVRVRYLLTPSGHLLVQTLLAGEVIEAAARTSPPRPALAG